MDLVHLVLDGISMAREDGDEVKLPLRMTYDRSISKVSLLRTSVREGVYPYVEAGEIYSLNESLHETSEESDEVSVDFEMVYDRSGNRVRLVRIDRHDGGVPDELTSVHNTIKSEGVAKQEDKKQSPGQGQPEQEPRAEIDLSRESLASPARPASEEVDRLILSEFRTRAEESPRGAIRWLYGVVRNALAMLLPEHRPTLRHGQAAPLISKLKKINLHPTQLRRYFDEGRLEIGVLGPDNEPQFSKADCEDYVTPTAKKPGPKSKNS